MPSLPEAGSLGPGSSGGAVTSTPRGQAGHRAISLGVQLVLQLC